MRSDKSTIDQPVEPIDAAEARMRLALGLGGTARPAHSGSGPAPSHTPASSAPSHDAPRPRRRFAQDGDVPVVVISRREGESGGENRLATLMAELREERNRRARAERALEDANTTVQSLQTKLAHTEMACEEKLRDANEVRAQLESLRIEDQEARKRADIRHAEAALAVSMLERRIAELEAAAEQAQAARPRTDLFGDVVPEKPARAPRKAAKAAATAAPVAAIGSPEAEPASDDDQPIEWWLPSFRATRTRNAARKPKSR